MGNETKRKASRVLILLTRNKIGDAIFALPVIRAVRRHFGSQTELWLMCLHGPPAPAAPAELLIERANIHGIIPFPAGAGISAVLTLIPRLRRLGFDCAVNAGGADISGRAFIRNIFLLKAGGISKLLGFQKSISEDSRGGSFALKPKALSWLERLAKDGLDISLESDFSIPLISLSEPERKPAREWLCTRRKHLDRPLIAICPGTGEPANAWPIERFAEIGRRLLDLNLYELVVCGGPTERAAGDHLIKDWGQGLNAAGEFTVLGSAAILGECQFMIGLDTGTTHLAAAVGVPCVTLQGGRVRPGAWDPLGPGHIIVRYPVACGGCALGTCCLSRHPCMRGITVDMVWQAVEEMRTRLSRVGVPSAA